LDCNEKDDLDANADFLLNRALNPFRNDDEELVSDPSSSESDELKSAPRQILRFGRLLSGVGEGGADSFPNNDSESRDNIDRLLSSSSS